MRILAGDSEIPRLSWLFKIAILILVPWLCGFGEKINGGFASAGPAQAATVPAAITLVQQAELSVGSGSTSTSLSFPGASTTGDLIIATVKWGGQNLSVASITDNKSNLYQSALGPTNWSGTAKCAQTFAARNIAGGGVPIVITVHLTGGSTSNLHLYQFEYSGADANAPLDAGSTATGSGATLSSGTLTTRYGNELIHAVAFTGTGTTMPGAGFQTVTTYASNLVETKTATTAGAYLATASDTVSADWFIHALTIKAAPPDTTPPVVNMTAPANGATVSGSVGVSANATDNVRESRRSSDSAALRVYLGHNEDEQRITHPTGHCKGYVEQ